MAYDTCVRRRFPPRLPLPRFLIDNLLFIIQNGPSLLSAPSLSLITCHSFHSINPTLLELGCPAPPRLVSPGLALCFAQPWPARPTPPRLTMPHLVLPRPARPALRRFRRPTPVRLAASSAPTPPPRLTPPLLAVPRPSPRCPTLRSLAPPRLASPRFASPRRAALRCTAPRLDSPRLVSPRLASP